MKTLSACACCRKFRPPAARRATSISGRTTNNRAIFSVFWTDGKRYRVILARDMTGEEITFYERKNSEFVLLAGGRT